MFKKKYYSDLRVNLSIIDNRTEQALYKIKNFKIGDFEKNIKEVMKKFK